MFNLFELSFDELQKNILENGEILKIEDYN